MRRLLTALLALALLLAGAETLAWRWAAGQMRDAWAQWAEARRAEGWQVESGVPAIGGWPFRVALTIPGLSLSSGTAIPGLLAWRAERLVLRVPLLGAEHLTVAPQGAQSLRLAGAPPVGFTAARMRAFLPLAPAATETAEIAARDLRLDAPTGNGGTAPLAVARLSGTVTVAPQARRGEEAVGFDLRAEALDLPPDAAPLGPRVTAAALRAQFTGPLPATGALASRAATWRDHGGEARIGRFALDWGTLHAEGHGTLRLGPDLQPLGTLNTSLTGAAGALDAMAARGAIPHSMAVAAKAVLMLMRHAPEAGGAPEVTVPLQVRDGTVFLGNSIPLARLPRLDWPGL